MSRTQEYSKEISVSIPVKNPFFSPFSLSTKKNTGEKHIFHILDRIFIISQLSISRKCRAIAYYDNSSEWSFWARVKIKGEVCRRNIHLCHCRYKIEVSCRQPGLSIDLTKSNITCMTHHNGQALSLACTSVICNYIKYFRIGFQTKNKFFKYYQLIYKWCCSNCPVWES